MSGQESGGPDAIGPVAIGPIAIGIDIGATKVLGGVVDVGTGSVLYSEEIPALPRRDPEVVLDDIVGFAARLKNAAERDALAVHGLGGGIPEIVDPAGNLTTRDTFDWLDLPVNQRFSTVATPFVMESDVRAAASAEARFGAGQGLGSFAYITIGSGISSCLVLNGKPLVGNTGCAIVLTSATTRERCLVCGEAYEFCLEAYASGLGMTRRYAEAASRPITRAEEVFDAAAAGDAAAADIIETAARALGKNIAQLANLLDPAAIVIGGGLGLAPGPYRDTLIASIRQQIWHEPVRDLPIASAQLGAAAGMVGAALRSVEGSKTGGTE